MVARRLVSMAGHFTRTLARRIWNHPERCALANRALALAQEPTLRLAGAYHSP